MRGISGLSDTVVADSLLTEAEREERKLFRRLEQLASVSSQLLNIVTSISHALLTRTWTRSRQVDYAETLRSLADRLERIEPTELG